MAPLIEQLYKAETGRDAAADFGVCGHTWLPRRACAAPGCPHFLVRQPACQGGRVSDEVWRHLESAGVVPGLHRFLVQRLESMPAAITGTVCAGGHLLPCGVVLPKKVARIVGAVARLADDEGCDGHDALCRHIERCAMLLVLDRCDRCQFPHLLIGTARSFSSAVVFRHTHH